MNWRRIQAGVVGGAVFCTVAAIAALATIALPGWIEDFRLSTTGWVVVIQTFLPVVVGVIAGYFAGVRAFRAIAAERIAGEAEPGRWQKSRRARRLGVALLAGAYFLTWAFGAPAAQTQLARDTIKYYKELESRDHAPQWSRYPFLKSTVSFPLAPGVVATYYENQLAGLNGWGGWVFHLWYISGVKSLGYWTFWIS